MAIQPRYEPQGESDFFADHRVEREPIPGTVASAVSTGVVQVDHQLLLRGQERYAISCSPCHDRTGEGQGSIVQSGFQKPPALSATSLQNLKSAQIIDIIRDGQGSMAGYRGLISAKDMLAIAHYVKVLQLRSHTPAEWLDDKDRLALGVAK